VTDEFNGKINRLILQIKANREQVLNKLTEYVTSLITRLNALENLEWNGKVEDIRSDLVDFEAHVREVFGKCKWDREELNNSLREICRYRDSVIQKFKVPEDWSWRDELKPNLVLFENHVREIIGKCNEDEDQFNATLREVVRFCGAAVEKGEVADSWDWKGVKNALKPALSVFHGQMKEISVKLKGNPEQRSIALNEILGYCRSVSAGHVAPDNWEWKASSSALKQNLTAVEKQMKEIVVKSKENLEHIGIVLNEISGYSGCVVEKLDVPERWEWKEVGENVKPMLLVLEGEVKKIVAESKNSGELLRVTLGEILRYCNLTRFEQHVNRVVRKHMEFMALSELAGKEMCRYLLSVAENLDIPVGFIWACQNKETAEFEKLIGQSIRKIKDERRMARRLNDTLRSGMADEGAAMREQCEGRIQVMEKFFQMSVDAVRRSLEGGGGS
jgi:hypothetical protein